MFTRLSTILLALVLCLPSLAFSKSEAIQKLLDTYVKQGYTTGIAVAIIQPKEVTFYNAGKMTRTSRAHPITNNTIFPIASITKIFTTVALANEALQDKVDLNKPAQLCMPPGIRLPFYHRDYPIRVINLATHTASLAPMPGQIGRANPYKDVSKSTIARYLRYHRLIYPPGSRYIYSDLGIALAGFCVAEVAKMPYQEYIEEKILRPLNLRSTLFSIPWYRKPDLVTGYKADGEKARYWKTAAMTPATGLYSSSKDLAIFLRNNMGLNKSSLYPAMTLTHRGIFSEGKDSRNTGLPKTTIVQSAMGWNVHRNLVWKTGSYPGFSSFIGFLKGKNHGVVVLANTGNALYTNNLALHLLNPKYKLLPRYIAIKIGKEALKGFSGKYKITGGDLYKITNEDDHLKTVNLSRSFNIRNSFNLYPLGNNRFFGRVDNAVFTFTRNKQGDITGFKLIENDQTFYAKKLR